MAFSPSTAPDAAVCHAAAYAHVPITSCAIQTDMNGRELITHGMADFPIACYYGDLSTWAVPWHWHEELEILLISEGSVLAAAGNEKFTLNAGDGLFINAGVLHADWHAAPGACLLRSIVFHPRLVGGTADSVFWQKYLQPLLTDPSRPCAVLRPGVPWQRTVLEAFERAYRAVLNDVPGYEFRARAELSECIWLLTENAPATRPLPKKALRSADRIKTMLQFVQLHYAEELTVEQIAASASISPSECLRCFRDMIGTTPNQYLRTQRAQRAAELLCGTGLPVTEIAAQCGFQDSSYFARAFRQVYGCGPTEYRRSARREAAK